MSKLVVILGFLVSFAAGLMVGWRVVSPLHPGAAGLGSAEPARGHSTTQTSGPRGRDPRGWLTEVLKLSSEQQAQMKEIWDDPAHQGRREHDERRQALRKSRDESITRLLTETGK